jgi:ribosomal protein L37AE/L43A
MPVLREQSRFSSRPASPTYLEAYACISVGGLLREAEAGRSSLLWRDQRDRIAGAALLKASGHDALTVSYCVGDLVYDEACAGELVLQLSWKGSRADNARPFAACPECPRDVDVLVLRNGIWCCAQCHRLSHRSAKLRKEIRWAEQLAQLNERLDVPLMLATTRLKRQELEAKRRSLQEQLSGRAPTASTDYLRVLHVEYVAGPGGISCSLV